MLCSKQVYVFIHVVCESTIGKYIGRLTYRPYMYVVYRFVTKFYSVYAQNEVVLTQCRIVTDRQ